MSYDISIVDKNKETIILDKPFLEKGGTYAVGGTSLAEFNITFNYSKFLEKSLGYSIKELDGKKVEDTLDNILNAILKLKDDDKTDNYWDPTEYNTKQALKSLLKLGLEAPNGYWEVLY